MEGGGYMHVCGYIWIDQRRKRLQRLSLYTYMHTCMDMPPKEENGAARTEEAHGDVGHDGAEHGGGRLDVQPPPAVRLRVSWVSFCVCVSINGHP